MSYHTHTSQIDCKFGAKCRDPTSCKFVHPTSHQKNKEKSKIRGPSQMKKKPLNDHIRIHTAIHQFIKVGKDLLNRRSVALQQKADFEKKYVLADVKGTTSTPYDSDLKLIESEVKQLKSMAFTMFGNRTVRFPLGYVISVVNTAGQTNKAVITMDASLSSEFASLSLLFDEMKTHNVLLTHIPTSITSSSITVAAAGGMAIMVVDTIDQVPLTGVDNGIQYSDKKLYSISNLWGTNGPIAASINTMHRLKFKVPHGPPINNSSAVASATLTVGDSWVDTIGTPGAIDIVGFAKWYEINATNTALAVGIVAMEFDTEFRMRE